MSDTNTIQSREDFPTVENHLAAPTAKPKRPTKSEWRRIQREYESSTISQRDLAAREGVSVSTLMKRAMRDKWRSSQRLVKQSAAKLEADLNEKAIAIVREELAPWIEEQKIKITKRGFKVGERGLSRVEKFFRSQKPNDSKAEANIARSAETFLRMARTSLGMSEGTGLNGSLSVQILTNQAAVAVNT